MQDKHAPFFLLRMMTEIKRHITRHPSLMTKDEFVHSRLAARCAFFAAGIATSPWASLMPFVKERLALNEMHYASLLLCYGLGAVIGMPLTGRLALRFGVRPIILLSCLGTLIGMSAVGFEHLTLFLAYGAVLLWGLSIGVFDVANNIHGTYIEEQAARHLMSSFHAWYTVGCISAALFCAIALHAGIHSFAVVLSIDAAAVILLIFMGPRIINTHGTGVHDSKNPETEPAEAPAIRHLMLPAYLTMPVMAIGIVSLIMYLTEGMVYDWSAVYLINRGGLDITIASIGYLAFQIAVAIMRFKGDALLDALGAVKLIAGGGVLAAAALFVLAISSNSYVLVGALFTAGLALANVVPVMLSKTAALSGRNQGKAIAFVGTLGYAGLLLGPGILGAIATVFGLSAMFVLTGALAVVLSLLALWILKKAAAVSA